MSRFLAPPPYGDGRHIRVGLLGGSFNPAHDGHLHISLEALRRLDLHQVWWLVSPGNPLKVGQPMASLAQRLARARALACRHPRVVPTGLETAMGTRYTIDTLRMVQQRFRRVQFVWLMGADNLEQFHRWRAWQRITEIVPVAVFDRPGYSLTPVHARAAQRLAEDRLPLSRAKALANTPPPAWVFLPIRLHGASATAIRAKGGESGIA